MSDKPEELLTFTVLNPDFDAPARQLPSHDEHLQHQPDRENQPHLNTKTKP